MEQDKTELEQYMACYNCGSRIGLVLMPHRNINNDIVGWLFACKSCWKLLAGRDAKVELVGDKRDRK